MNTIRKGSASSEENDQESFYAELEFKVEYKSKIGQILHICGNVEELGNWNADNSPRLRTNPNIYPYWESNFNFSLPVGMTIEYKYVLIPFERYALAGWVLWQLVDGILIYFGIYKDGNGHEMKGW